MRKPYALERRAPYLVAFILMTTTASSTLAQTQSGGNNWSVFLTLRHTEAIDRVQNDIATPRSNPKRRRCRNLVRDEDPAIERELFRPCRRQRIPG